MANRNASLKDIRKSKKRTARNLVKSKKAKILVKKTRKAIVDAQMDEAKKIIVLATQALDKAAKMNVIHPNKAARLKSRLQRRINAMKTA